MDRTAGYVVEIVFCQRVQKLTGAPIQYLLCLLKNHIHDACCRPEKAKNKRQLPVQHTCFFVLTSGMLKSRLHQPVLLIYVLQQSMKTLIIETVRFVLKRLSLMGDESIK